MKDMTLFQIADEWRALEEMAADPEADEESFSAAIAEAAGAFDSKVVALASIAKNLDAQAEAIDAAAKAMLARSKRANTRSASIRKFILSALHARNVTKVAHERFVVSARKSPPSVEIADDAVVPDDLMRIIPEQRVPNKTAIKAAINAGREMDGVRLIQNQYLEIK